MKNKKPKKTKNKFYPSQFTIIVDKEKGFWNRLLKKRTIKVYVNADLKQSLRFRLVKGKFSTSFWADVSGSYGNIEYVSMWNKVLSKREKEDLYNNGNGRKTNLRRYFSNSRLYQKKTNV